MFELIHLRCFLAVAEELHFGRAAARLNMTQPPLSRQIQVLERILNIKLFERNSRAVSLTAAGKAFLVEARRVVQLADSSAAIARSAAEGKQGLVMLGFTAASGYCFVPRLLQRMHSELPDLQLLLKEMVSGEQTEALITGRIDIGLLRPPIRRTDFSSQLVVREPLVACSPASVPENLIPTTLSDFDRVPFIMYAPDIARYFYDLVAGLFASAGAAPRYVQHVGQIHSILTLVGAGLGYALVPEAASKLHPEGVVFSRVDGLEPIVELHATWLKDMANPGIERVLEAIDSMRDQPDREVSTRS